MLARYFCDTVCSVTCEWLVSKSHCFVRHCVLTSASQRAIKVVMDCIAYRPNHLQCATTCVLEHSCPQLTLRQHRYGPVFIQLTETEIEK